MMEFGIPFSRCFFCSGSMWVFPKIGVPQNGWFIIENPIKMAETPMSIFRGKNTKPRQQQIFVFQLRWVYTGFKLFGADVRASYFLTKRVFKGAAAKMTKSWGLGKVVLVDFKIATEIGDVTNDVSFTGWWQLQIFFFLCSPRKLGKMNPF